MKSLALASVLALSTAAFGASNSAINDLQYLPNAGTFFGDTSFSYMKFSTETFNGTKDIKSENKGYMIQQVAGYALMDNFSLALGLGYSDTKSESTDSDSTKSTGLGDIGVAAKYRLIDSASRLDLLANLSISPGDSEIKSDGDSNNYTGGHSVDLGAEWGMKKENHQFSIKGLYTYNLKAKTDDKEADLKSETDAHSALTFDLNLLTKLDEKCFIKTFAGVNFTEEYEDDADSTYSASTYYRLGAEYQHVFTKDVYARAGFTSLIGGNGDSLVVMLYSVGAGYQF